MRHGMFASMSWFRQIRRKVEVVIGMAMLGIAAVLIGAAAVGTIHDKMEKTAIKIPPAQAAGATIGSAATPKWRPSPKFDGDVLPEPPAQNHDWVVPPSDLPDSYVNAAKTLFDQGLADPRDCEYREIEVATGGVWSGDGGVVETHGWVLPGNGPRHFAVGWNGLVYQVMSIGPAADWRADADATINLIPIEYNMALSENLTVSWETCLPIKGCLILRLGDAKLAEQLWSAIQLARHREMLRAWERSPHTDSWPKPVYAFDVKDPYADWAARWAWALYDRVVCAHMRGDDHLALLSARKLNGIRPLLETEAGRRGIERPIDGNSNKPLPYFGFLNPLADILNDQERRAGQAKQATALELIKGGKLAQADRIQLLIRDLDEVAVRQHGQPGGLGPADRDPIVAALIREGEPVIEPLLQCLESESASHLTRSVSFGRDFFPNRTPHTLRMPIRAVLLAVMKTTVEAVGLSANDLYFEPKTTASGEAGRLRAYWQRYGTVPEAERWYLTLADDSASKKAWIDAIQHIVRNRKDEPLAGESLRTKQQPSVAELLVKRAEGFVRDRANWNDSNQGFNIRDTAHFIDTAMKWEAAPMLPVARELMRSIIDVYGANPKHGHPWSEDFGILAGLTVTRASAGDMAALTEWAQWIRMREPTSINSNFEGIFAPMRCFPKHPAIQAAMTEMFGNPDSPWHSLEWFAKNH